MRNGTTPRGSSAALPDSLVHDSTEPLDTEASALTENRQFALPIVCGALLAGIVIGFFRKRR